MVFWVKDPTGRFRERPHYEPAEIDAACERIVVAHLNTVYGAVTYPLTTNDLTIIVESLTSNLDLYADLTEDGPDVEGVTNFKPGRKPEVGIAQSLFEDERRANRARTTLAHELGHVVFHDPLFQTKMRSPDLFAAPATDRVICKRDTIINATTVDWLEWQAGYASGAFLMPRTAVEDMVRNWRRAAGHHGAVAPGTPDSRALVHMVRSTFTVSADAATVRLLKLGHLGSDPVFPTLFDSRS